MKIGLVDLLIAFTQIYLQKNCKLHKFATCNQNFEKSRLSDMHYPLTDIQADFEINRPILDIKLPRKEIISTDDRRTNRRIGVAYDNKKEKATKNYVS